MSPTSTPWSRSSAKPRTRRAPATSARRARSATARASRRTSPLLRAVSGKGKPVVTVLLSGRPLYVNDLMNLSDAFVAAWLPGTEGKGVADVLIARHGNLRTTSRASCRSHGPESPVPAPSPAAPTISRRCSPSVMD